MPCYSPLIAYQTMGGEIVFSELQRNGAIKRQLDLPCGQCIGCRLERARQWAVRCMHEASLYKQNCFVTLTYSDEHLPKAATLVYRDFELFMKRLRKAIAPTRVRFYMCGEYGETNPTTNVRDGGKYRPHYHACLFGWEPPDKKFYKVNSQDQPVFSSLLLNKIWGLGDTKTAELNYYTAGYTARYCVAKITGKNAHLVYGEREPEFNNMSRMPGIGAPWLDKYKTDVYNYDHVIVNGKECKPPKFYDKILKGEDNQTWEIIKENREWAAYKHRADNTDDRLKVKETVLKAKLKALKKTL